MSQDFELHPTLAADTFEIGDLPLCRVLLMNDARYPWLILVPRQSESTEVWQLSDEDQQQLLRESNLIAEKLANLLEPDKLNIASIGNKVSQLHLHHIARFEGDDVWPEPVWGRGERLTYPSATRDEVIAAFRQQLADDLI